MATSCSDSENRPGLRSLYSTAAKRQACVPCPSACSCDLGSRSVMDQFMARAWSQGTEGNTSVFNFHKENYNEGSSKGACWGSSGGPGSTAAAAKGCVRNDQTTWDKCLCYDQDNLGECSWGPFHVTRQGCEKDVRCSGGKYKGYSCREGNPLAKSCKERDKDEKVGICEPGVWTPFITNKEQCNGKYNVFRGGTCSGGTCVGTEVTKAECDKCKGTWTPTDDCGTQNLWDTSKKFCGGPTLNDSSGGVCYGPEVDGPESCFPGATTGKLCNTMTAGCATWFPGDPGQCSGPPPP